MGWFSLVTKVVPKLWRGGTKVTSTLWNGGASVAGAGTKVVTAVAKNPKTTGVTGVAAYAGWDERTNPDKSIGTATDNPFVHDREPNLLYVNTSFSCSNTNPE